MGHILVIKFHEDEMAVFEQVMELLQQNSGFVHLQVMEAQKLSVLGLDIYPEQHQIYHDSQEIQLTAKEYGILYFLAANRGRVLTYDQIYQKVWGEDALGRGSNSIGCHIRNLRGKLHRAAPNALFTIRCVREVGYCFDAMQTKE